MRILVVWMFSRTVKRTMRAAMSVIEVISHFLAAFGRHSTYLIKPWHGQEWQTANFRFCRHNSIMFQKIPGACSEIVPDGVSLIWQWLNKKWARYSKCPTSGWCPKSGLGIVLYCTCFIYCHLNFDSTLFEFHRICTQLFVPLVRGVHRAPSRARAFVRARAKNWLGFAWGTFRLPFVSRYGRDSKN